MHDVSVLCTRKPRFIPKHLPNASFVALVDGSEKLPGICSPGWFVKVSRTLCQEYVPLQLGPTFKPMFACQNELRISECCGTWSDSFRGRFRD